MTQSSLHTLFFQRPFPMTTVAACPLSAYIIVLIACFLSSVVRCWLCVFESFPFRYCLCLKLATYNLVHCTTLLISALSCLDVHGINLHSYCETLFELSVAACVIQRRYNQFCSDAYTFCRTVYKMRLETTWTKLESVKIFAFSILFVQ